MKIGYAFLWIALPLWLAGEEAEKSSPVRESGKILSREVLPAGKAEKARITPAPVPAVSVPSPAAKDVRVQALTGRDPQTKDPRHQALTGRDPSRVDPRRQALGGAASRPAGMPSPVRGVVGDGIRR